MNTKSPFASKTLWTNLIMAVLAFIPGVHQFVVDKPEVMVVVFTVVNMLLRFVSKDKIQLG